MAYQFQPGKYSPSFSLGSEEVSEEVSEATSDEAGADDGLSVTLAVEEALLLEVSDETSSDEAVSDGVTSEEVSDGRSDESPASTPELPESVEEVPDGVAEDGSGPFCSTHAANEKRHIARQIARTVIFFIFINPKQEYIGLRSRSFRTRSRTGGRTRRELPLLCTRRARKEGKTRAPTILQQRFFSKKSPFLL